MHPILANAALTAMVMLSFYLLVKSSNWMSQGNPYDGREEEPHGKRTRKD